MEKDIKYYVENINDELVSLAKRGLLNSVWCFIRDVKNYELQFYFDPGFVYNDGTYSEEDLEKFAQYKLYYDYEDGLGALIGRLNKYGYFDIQGNLQKIEYLKVKPGFNVFEDEKVDISYYDSVAYGSTKNQDISYLIFQSEEAYYKICEAVLLLFIQIIRSDDILSEKKFYENIHAFQQQLNTKIFDGYLTIVARYFVDGVPRMHPLLGFDVDEFDVLLPSSGEMIVFQNIEQIIKILDYDDVSTVSLLSESIPTLEEFGINIEPNKLVKKDLVEISTKIEDSFRKLYRRNFNNILVIIRTIKEHNALKETEKLIKFIENSQRNIELNGSNNIYLFVKNLIVPFLESKVDTDFQISKIKEYFVQFEIARSARNFSAHEYEQLSTKSIIISIYAFAKILKCIRIIESILVDNKVFNI